MAVNGEGSTPLANRPPNDPQTFPPAITTSHYKTHECFTVILQSSSAFQVTAFQEVPP